MADVATAAKLRFLDASSHALSSSAPATSAHLMLQLNREAADHDLQLRGGESSGGACKACGRSLVPGRTSRISIVKDGASKSTTRSRSHGNGSAAMARNKYLRIDCLVCHRFEKKPLPRSTGDNTKKQTGFQSQLLLSATPTADAASNASPQSMKTGNVNASSKQRAKARKHGGLQAMLEKSKASASLSSGFGLDLLDFMKQS